MKRRKKGTPSDSNWQAKFFRELDSRTHGCWDRAFAIKAAHLPEKIYKYRAPNDDAWLPITTGKLYLSPPAKFNDPLDSNICFRVEPRLVRTAAEHILDKYHLSNHPEAPNIRRESTIEGVYRRFAKIAKPGFSPKKLEFLVESMCEGNHEALIQVREQFATLFRTNTQICSLTTDVTSVIMWSHYAANHTGICIEWSMKDIPLDHPARRLLYPVKYGTQRYDIGQWAVAAEDGSRHQHLPSVLAALHKSRDWAYEQEWRLVDFDLDSDRGRLLELPKASAVYLGMNASDDTARKAQEVAKDIPIFKMRPCNSEYVMRWTEAPRY